MFPCFPLDNYRDWTRLPQPESPSFLEPSLALSYKDLNSGFLQGIDQKAVFVTQHPTCFVTGYKKSLVLCVACRFQEPAKAYDLGDHFGYMGVENGSAFCIRRLASTSKSHSSKCQWKVGGLWLLREAGACAGWGGILNFCSEIGIGKRLWLGVLVTGDWGVTATVLFDIARWCWRKRSCYWEVTAHQGVCLSCMDAQE